MRKPGFVEKGHPELLRLLEFAPRPGTRDHIVGLLTDTGGHLAAFRLDAACNQVARFRQRTGQHERQSREFSVGFAPLCERTYAALIAQPS